MQPFVPRDKMSKRRRAALDRQKRVVWDMRPVTKVNKSKKLYDRKKQPRSQDPYDGAVLFYGYKKLPACQSAGGAVYCFSDGTA